MCFDECPSFYSSLVCLFVCFDGRPPTALRVSASKQSHIESLDLEPQAVPFYWAPIMDMV
jgi:hypothetical protein